MGKPKTGHLVRSIILILAILSSASILLLIRPVQGGNLSADFSFSPTSPAPFGIVTFTATATGGIAPYIFNWSFGDGLSGAGNPATHAFSNSGLYNVRLVVNDTTAPSQRVVIFHTVRVTMNADFSFTPSSPAAGDPVTFTGTVNATRGTPPFTFKWDFGDGSSLATGNPVTHSYTLAKTYIVNMTVTDSSIPAKNEAITHPVTPIPTLGIDCGLGSFEGYVNPNAPPAIIGNGASLYPSCTWSGDTDALTAPDTTIEPLVTDSPESPEFQIGSGGNPPTVPATTGTGGGFSAEVRLFNQAPPPPTGCPDPSCINGFDVTVLFDIRYLHAVWIDQRGLPFGDQQPSGSSGVNTFAGIIDNTQGLVRLSQTINGVTVAPDANNGITLYRIRFDVIGTGSSTLRFPCNAQAGQACQVYNPGVVPVKAQNGMFDSSTYLDVVYGQTLSFNATWTFTPNPPRPGSTITMTATATCPGCLGTLSYSWDFDSSGTVDATGNPVQMTMPTATLHANRVVLTVTNGTVAANVTRRLPLNDAISNPGPNPVGSAIGLNGQWLGGNTPYTGTWRLCPGTGTTANFICTRPSPSITSTSNQNDAQTVTYSFAGAYNITLKITDSVSRETAAASVTRSILLNVTGTPQAFTVTIAPSNANPTPGEQITFSATVTYDTGYTSFRSTSFSYLFDFGDGTTSTVSSAGLISSSSNTYASAGTYVVKVFATERSAVAVSKIQEVGRVTLNVAFPPITGSFSPSSTTSNTGDTISFTAAVSGGTSTYTFNWNFGDGTAGSGNPASHSYSSPGTYTVTLTVTDSSGASQTFTKQVQVNASSPVSLLIPLLAAVAVAAAAGLFLFIRKRRAPRATL